MCTLANSEDQDWNATESRILSGSALFAGTEVHLNLVFLNLAPGYVRLTSKGSLYQTRWKNTLVLSKGQTIYT